MDIEAEAKKLLEANRRIDKSGYQYTVPSADHYPYQWLWDSCFHAIILAQYDPESAKKELISLLAKQFADGMVPHIIYWSPGILHLFRWGVDGISALTQPPMIAYAAWEVHRAANDPAFLEQIYPALLSYYQFLLTRRDPYGQHLAGIINPDESGEDNSPRFDSVLGCPPDVSYEDHHVYRVHLVDANRENGFDVEQCIKNGFWVKDVLFNAVLVENLRALGHIASLLKHADGEHFAHENAELVAKAMREEMFEDGVYWSVEGLGLNKLKVPTWNHFVPLFAGLYTQDEAERAVKEHFHNDETFHARFGIRTTSKQVPGYRAAGFAEGFSWRGPVWIAPHWFIYRGLLRYGFTAEAREICEKSEELLQYSGFRECFNPDTGEGIGARGFTWGALVLDMRNKSNEN